MKFKQVLEECNRKNTIPESSNDNIKVEVHREYAEVFIDNDIRSFDTVIGAKFYVDEYFEKQQIKLDLIV